MAELAWWEYLIITISAFFALSFLNYLVKVLNDSRFEKHLAALEEKALQNHATPITPLSIANPILIETQLNSAMGQLFSTNRSRANSAINTLHSPISQAREPTIQPPSDTTIIIPLHGKPIETLEVQPSEQSDPEPIINNLGNIYKDELPAFDVSDSNLDMEDISDVPNNLEHGGELPQPPVTLESTWHISSDGEDIEHPSGLEISGVKMDIQNGPENIENIHNQVEGSEIQNTISNLPYNLINDIPDELPDIRNESLFDAVEGLASDVPQKRGIVAVTNSVTVSYDKNTMLSKNSMSAAVDIDTPDPSEENENSVKEWVEGLIEETIKTDNKIPENEL